MARPRELWSVWDLDGCLSDDSWRKHHVTGKHRNYDAYHAGCHRDGLRRAEAELLVSWRTLMPYRRVAIFTGRPEGVRVKTVEWLKRNMLWAFVDLLLMRPEGSNLPATELKWSMHRTSFKGDVDVVFAVDDQEKIIAMWRAAGVPCLQSIDLSGGGGGDHGPS